MKPAKIRYSDYTVEQLREIVGELKEKLQKAEQFGNISEVQILERKMQVALAYMMNPDDYKPNGTYEMNGDPGHHFRIDYIDGVFAWGKRINLLGEEYEEQEAVPISLLGKKITK